MSVKDGQIVGEDFYSGCQCGKFGRNKTERLSKNLGRDVKAGSDLVGELLFSICGPLHSPLVFLLDWDALKEGFSGRNPDVQI